MVVLSRSETIHACSQYDRTSYDCCNFYVDPSGAIVKREPMRQNIIVLIVTRDVGWAKKVKVMPLLWIEHSTSRNRMCMRDSSELQSGALPGELKRLR